MKPIDIYALTRISNVTQLGRLEKQMSKRKHALKIKEWEIGGLRDLARHLKEELPGEERTEFFYSFQMPKLGKEFDLLRVSDDCVVNIELKSGGVTDEVIKKQLLQNRYYLATLGKSIYSFTYINSEDRLVRLTNGNHLVEAEWRELAAVLQRQKQCYADHIEELFKEDTYLISPLTDPGRFLRQEYFLTSQQNDIRRQILKRIRTEQCRFQGFTGLPGTGKTILLYDIAMQLSWKDRVCVFHFGSHAKEMEHLDDRLKRIDFIYCENDRVPEVAKRYAVIFVDEGHRITECALESILRYSEKWDAPLVFSYDCEDAIAPGERPADGAALIEKLPDFITYHLTNRIRVNAELSAFIHCLMQVSRGKRREEYPSVSLYFANDEHEAALFVRQLGAEGYRYICDSALPELCVGSEYRMETSAATCKEFDKVVMMVDDSFRYDDEGYLRYAGTSGSQSVRNLFHGLSRAKKQISLIVLRNGALFESILDILQRKV